MLLTVFIPNDLDWLGATRSAWVGRGAAAFLSSPITILGLMPPDDEPDDAFGFQPPLPPEDRLWRHPSELGPAGASQSVTIVNRPKVATRVWVVGSVSAVLGSALTLAILLGVGAFDPDNAPAPVEVVPIQVPRETGADELAWAEPVLPAVARVDAQTASGDRNGTGVVYRSDGHLLTTADAVEGRHHDHGHLLRRHGRDRRRRGDRQCRRRGGAPRRPDRPAHGDDRERDIARARRAGGRHLVRHRPPRGPTVGVGLISGLSQRVEESDGEVLHDMVQTNVRLAPDATGSPLVDSSGTVVASSPAAAPRAHPTATRAVPSSSSLRDHDRVGQRVADDLVATGHVRQVWLGVRGANLTDDEIGGSVAVGPKLVSVADGSPAAVAGLQTGDVVLGIDTRFVTSSSDLVVALRNHEPGDPISITYRRDEQGSTLATLGEKSGTP